MRLAKITIAVAAVVILTGFTFLAFNSGVAGQKLNLSVPKLQSTESRLKSVNVQYEQLNSKLDKQTSSDKKTIDQLNAEKAKLQKQQQDLQKQLESKADEKAKLAQIAEATVNKVTATSTVSADPLPNVVIDGCGDNSYANYIYMHESSCGTARANAEGCLGIGQACPASKLLAVCPNLDYACENAFFTSYAIGRYGSWEAAYNFWLNNHWW